MADVVVSGGGDSGDAQTVAEAAHEAAVAEGATAVNAEQAAEAAAEATAAAEIALAAAEANIEAGAAIESGVASAESSAVDAMVSAEMVHEALAAQTAAITALTDELKLQRESAARPPKESSSSSSPAPDAEPGPKIPGYYRKIGG